MKKIKITEITERKAQYDVFLYPSKRLKFNSRAKAEAFLREESSRLTDQLYKDLEVFRMIQNTYLSNWGVFERRTSAQIEETLSIVLSLFDRAVHRQIDNYTTASFLHKAESHLLKATTLMRDVAKKNSNTPLVYGIDSIQRFIDIEPEGDQTHWRIAVQAG